MEVVLVPGNHEFYHVDLDDALLEGRRLAKNLGVHFLDSDQAIIGGVRFLGCTLWTDYALIGDQRLGMLAAEMALNDHRCIKLRDGTFRPKDALARHIAGKAWLEGMFAKPHDEPTVVVTHHCISQRSVDDRWRMDALSAAFSSNLDRLVESSNADVWVHGHTHDSFDYRIGRTRVVCNPKGYGPVFRAANRKISSSTRNWSSKSEVIVMTTNDGKYEGLLARHRDWLEETGEMRSFQMFGFEVGPGWYQLMSKLFDDLATVVRPTGERLLIRQIKEKFGTLRFYWSGPFDDPTSERISEAIELAEFRSEVTCETCGRRGRLMNAQGWLATNCDAHAKPGGRPVNKDGPIVIRTSSPPKGVFEEVRYDPEADTVTRRAITRAEFERGRD